MSNEQTQAEIFRQGQTVIADRNKTIIGLLSTLQQVQTFLVERGLHQTIIADKVNKAIKNATE